MSEVFGRMGKKIERGFGLLANSSAMPSARTCLLCAVGLLLVFSLMMVSSASMSFAVSKGWHPLKYFWSQLGYMLIAIAVGMAVYQFPLKLWYSHRLIWTAFFVMLVLLGLVFLFPETNGAYRWVRFLGFSFQPAEFVKMFMVVIVAEYAHRSLGHMRANLAKAASLAVFYVPVALLLLKQPDFGSTLVLAGTLLAMFFVMGVPLAHFAFLTALFGLLGWVLLVSSDYRYRRLTSFLDPFDDPLNTDYQLLGSLVAYARGHWTGEGYTNSIQKLEHLPEAHTDFLLPITGEEFGFLGVMFVIVLEFILVLAIMRISYCALMRNQLKLGYTSFGFGVVLFGHVIINMGMSLGLLPTKGLTMPFFSYGGSSMLFSMIMVALVLKIDRESPRIAKAGESGQY